MWAVLGDIEFDLVNQPGRLDERATADYAQHALIQGKPRSEWVGDGLDELSLEITLHAQLTDPEAQIRRLKAALRAHDPLPLVLGTGDYRGIYLLTEVGTVLRRTGPEGQLVSATVSVSLLEYSGQYRKPLPVPRGLRNSLLATPGAQIGAAAPVIVTPAQQVLGMAHGAGNLLRAGVEAYSLARAQGGAQQLLGRVGELLRLSEQALSPLQGLQEAAGLMSGGADLVRVAVRAISEVQYATTILSPPSLESIVSQVDYAAGHMKEAQSTLAGASTRLARLAAAVITRRA